MNTIIKFLKLFKPDDNKFTAHWHIYKKKVSNYDLSVNCYLELKQFFRLYGLTFITNNEHFTSSTEAILQDPSRNLKISQLNANDLGCSSHMSNDVVVNTVTTRPRCSPVERFLDRTNIAQDKWLLNKLVFRISKTEHTVLSSNRPIPSSRSLIGVFACAGFKFRSFVPLCTRWPYTERGLVLIIIKMMYMH